MFREILVAGFLMLVQVVQAAVVPDELQVPAQNDVLEDKLRCGGSCGCTLL